MFDSGPQRIQMPGALDGIVNFPMADWFWPLLALLFAATLVAQILLRNRRGRRPKNGARALPATSAITPQAQLGAVAAANYTRVPLLNRPERALFTLLEQVVADADPDYRALAQISLGEAIRPAAGADKAAHAAINSKRLDMGVINGDGLLILAVEYQGTGHHQANAFLRDAVKREALRKAGIPLIEVEADASPDMTAARLRDALIP